MSRKYLIETYGCQMNAHDSERMAGLLEQAGYEPTDDAADADVVVIGGAKESRNLGASSRSEKVPVEDDAYDVVSARG